MPHPLVSLLAVIVGGSLGTLARFIVMRVVAVIHPLPDETYPLYVSASGTLIVNAAGCLFFGVVWALLNELRSDWSNLIMLAVLTGFLGAFTTFSTFAFEAQQLYHQHGIFSAAGYWFLQNIAGLACVLIGLYAGRILYQQYWLTTG